MSGRTHDIFISYRTADRAVVEAIARQLADAGLRVWFDQWAVAAGDIWQESIEKGLAGSAACAVFVGQDDRTDNGEGPSGVTGSLGRVQVEELRLAIDRRLGSPGDGPRFRVIPVLLPGATRGDRARLPAFLTLASWVEFRQPDDEAALRRLIAGARGEAVGRPQRAPTAECPYRGLDFFDIKHADLFFGRDAMVDWVLSALRGTLDRDGPRRFLALVGASGSGKSSLARAGVLAALGRGDLEGSASWPQVVLRPGERPLEALGRALAGTPGITLGQGLHATLVKEFMNEAKEDRLTLARTLGSVSGPPEAGRRAIILVDQFEEVFTHCPDSAERRAFVDNLLAAAFDHAAPAIVLITMRADFYGRCAEHADLADAVATHQFLIGPMRREELVEVIERPLLDQGWSIEPGLTERLLGPVGAGAGALPLLQHALRELWRRCTEHAVLTHQAFDAIGGVEGALNGHADAVLASLDESQRALCRRLLLRLVDPGEGTGDTRRRVPWEELRSIAGDAEMVERIVRRLADERLLTTGGDGDLAEGSTVEIVHEALLRNWGTLRGWIEADREGMRLRQRLTDAASEWRDSGVEDGRRDETLVYSGTRLALAREWVAEHPDELTADEEAFMAASIARETREVQAKASAAERELAQARELQREAEARAAAEAEGRRVAEESAARERRSRRWRQRMLAVSAILLVAGVGATIVAWRAFDAAARRTRIANALLHAVQSKEAGDLFPQRRLREALESTRATRHDDEGWLLESRQALVDALGGIGGTPFWENGDGSVSPQGGPGFLVSRIVAVGRTGKWMVTSNGQTGSLDLWRLDDPPRFEGELVASGRSGAPRVAASAPDRSVIVRLDDDGSLWAFDLGDENPIATCRSLPAPPAAVEDIKLADSAHALAARLADDTLALLDLRDVDSTYRVVHLSADERLVETHGTGLVTSHPAPDDKDERLIHVWKLDGGPSRAHVLRDHEHPAIAEVTVELSGLNGAIIRAGDDFALFRSGDAPRVEESIDWLGLDDARAIGISDDALLFFNPLRRTIQAVAVDPTADDPQCTSELRPGGARVVRIALDERLVTWTPEGDVLLEDVASEDARHELRLVGHDGGLQDLVFAGRTGNLVTFGGDGVPRLWTMPLLGDNAILPPAAKWNLHGHSTSLAIADSGSQVSLCQGNPGKGILVQAIPIPSTIGGEASSASPEHMVDRCARFSPGGDRSSAVLDLTFSDGARFVDAATIANIPEGTAAAATLPGAIIAVCGDGRHAFSSGEGRSLVRWTLSAELSSREAATVLSEAGDFTAMAPSGDGRRVVVVDREGQAILWEEDPSTAQWTSAPASDAPPCRTVAVTTDGSRMVAAGASDADGKLVGSEFITIVDLATREQCPSARFAGVRFVSCAIDDSGSLVVGGAEDGSVYVWDLTMRSLSTPDREIPDRPLRLPGSAGPNPCVAISGDGRTVAAAGDHLLVWPLDLPRLEALADRALGRRR